MIETVRNFLKRAGPFATGKPAREAYDIWSGSYDNQPGNLMLHLDEMIFDSLAKDIDLKNKMVVDIGCGTGRHWQKLYERKPTLVMGFDVSLGMLNQLSRKFPAAITQQTSDNLLNTIPDAFVDFLLTTLTIAHINRIEEAIAAWARVLKNHGDLLITDFHPAILAKGGKRSFTHNGKTLSVINYVHPLHKLVSVFKKHGLHVIRKEEKYIDETVRPYYQAQNALDLFDRFLGMPVIYGLHLKNRMLLNNLRLANSAHPVNIAVNEEKIAEIGTRAVSTGTGDFQIHFTDAVALPGLINSHDHLDFNCFSPLGQKKYDNYMEWGSDIHKTYKEDIEAVLKIPLPLRARWGMYKNLLSGITTVINHGSFLKIENPLINIYQESQNLHSVKFQKGWKWRLNNPMYKSRTCVIHTGEGTDEPSNAEIDELLKYNLLRRKLIGIHGVAMNARQAKKFSGLVWCPESNRILLNRQADIAGLKKNTLLVFGTDSTLTGSWDIWQHLRLARTLRQVSDPELFELVTRSPAKLWKINTGELSPGKDADILIAKTPDGNAAWNDVFSIRPEDILLIMQKGKVRMFDAAIRSRLRNSTLMLDGFSRIGLNGAVKFVEGDLPALRNAIRAYNGSVEFPIDELQTTQEPE